MSILAPAAPAVKTATVYQQRAQATRARRQAAGKYAKPSKAQNAAFAKAMRRDGRELLTVAECELLATHPQLASVQKSEFAALALEKAAQ